MLINIQRFKGLKLTEFTSQVYPCEYVEYKQNGIGETHVLTAYSAEIAPTSWSLIVALTGGLENRTAGASTRST